MQVRAKMKLVNKGDLIAIGSIWLDDVFVIHQVKIAMVGEDKRGVVLLPQKKKQEEWMKIFSIKDPELKKAIDQAVFDDIRVLMQKKTVLPDLAVRIVLVQDKNDLLAYATVTYNQMLEIGNIRIMMREDGAHVVFPYQIKGRYMEPLIEPDGLFETQMIEDKILTAYREKKSLANLTPQPERRSL